MRLSEGMPAPDFKATDMFGQPIDLESRAGKPVLLSFLRNGACALCNLQVHKLIRHYDQLHAAGLEIIAVFESPVESVTQHVGKQDSPFPIIADPEARLYALYGVESAEEKFADGLSAKQTALVGEAAAIGYSLTPEAGSNFFRLPADFLIGGDGIIRRALYSEAVGDHLSFAEIEQFAAQPV